MAEPHEHPQFANSLEYTVTLTYRVAGGKRRGTAERRAQKVAARLASAAARAADVVDVVARAGASVNGEVTWTDRVRFEAANSGHASYRDPSLLDRYLDPEYERGLRSLAAADETARKHRRADQERRAAVGCHNATFPTGVVTAVASTATPPLTPPPTNPSTALSPSTAASAAALSPTRASAACPTCRRVSSSSTTTRLSCTASLRAREDRSAHEAHRPHHPLPRRTRRATRRPPRRSPSTSPTQTCNIVAGGRRVLNIGRLAAGGGGYYLDAVASGAEDYYTGAGEAPGSWLTEAAAGLGLSGEVDPDDLRAVLAATDPRSGKPLPRTERRRVPGFDLAFRAPKSVSLLWALGDEATAAVVRDAHDQAVRAALGYLEANAAWSRRGRARERVPVAGLVAAGFRHRTSRAVDPLLHTHVLVANLGRCPDGEWRTLDARALYVHAKTAGCLYQAALRQQLSRRLGVAWTEVRNGTAEIDGVPRPVIEAFSRRRAEILAQLDQRGEHSARAAQTATLATRQAKDDAAGTDLHQAWAARAQELDFGSEQVAALLGRTRWREPTGDELTRVAERLAGPSGLTAQASTFTPREVIQAWCDALPAGAGVDEVCRRADAVLDPQAGLTVELLPTGATSPEHATHPFPEVDQVVEALAAHLEPQAAEELRGSTALREHVAALLAADWSSDGITAALLARELDSADAADAVLVWRAEQLANTHGPRQPDQPQPGAVIHRGDGRVVRANAGERRYSTPELLALEQRLVDQALARRDADVATADPHTVDAAIRSRPSLSAEQAAMVTRLATSGAGVEVVVGKAGAGKTLALDAARAAWHHDGTRVVGAALAARAAAELEAGAGIDAYTIDALLADLDRPGPSYELPRGGVLVIDEAGMVGTRKLARLADHAEAADAKVVLVGDHHQLPELDAGGAFRGLTARLDPIELTDNRRQHRAWERDVLDQLRHGDPAAAVAAYADHGDLVVAETADAARERLVDDWSAAWQTHGPQAGVMIAVRRADVDDLNDRARARLAAAGELTGPAVEAADRAFQAGDRVVALHNDRRLGVVNGTRATVTTVDPGTRTLSVATDAGAQLCLPAGYLDDGHLAHGYAVSGHKAQGLTTRQAWVLGSDELYREWGYVALSRGREANRLYVVAGDAALDTDDHCHTPDSDNRDAVTELAAALERSRGQALAIDHTRPAAHLTSNGQSTARLRELLATAPADPSRELAWIRGERDAAAQQLDGARGRHQQATQRLQEATGGLGRLVNRSTVQQARAQVDRAAADADRWHTRLTDLAQHLSKLDVASRQRQAWLQSHSGELAEAHAEVSADQGLVLQRAQAAEFHTPTYLAEVLGARPAEPAQRRAWRAAVTAVEAYRAAHAITDPQRALGEPPAEPGPRAAYDHANHAIRAVHEAAERTHTHLNSSEAAQHHDLG